MRPLVFAALATVALSTASPAWAHEEITPGTFATGRPTFFTLSAANEKGADLTAITLTPPSGLALGEATRQPPGWTAQPSRGAVTWSGGRVAPHAFEQWGFEIEGADQPGPLRYKVTMAFADGSSEDAEVEVVATAASGAGPAPAPTQAAAPTTAAATLTVPAAPGATAASRDDGARSRAAAALAVGVLAGVLALVALGLAARRRWGPSPGPAARGTTEEGQDW